jgi:hypothetical protein
MYIGTIAVWRGRKCSLRVSGNEGGVMACTCTTIVVWRIRKCSLRVSGNEGGVMARTCSISCAGVQPSANMELQKLESFGNNSTW